MKCDECEMMFNNPSTLAQHKYSHKELKYQCRTSGKWFPFDSTLNNHRAVHRRHPSHQCTKCGKWYFTVGELNKHLKVHEEHVHQCYECSYTTYDPRYLRAHLYTHSMEERYVCKYCGMKFKHHTQMLRHIESKACPRGGQHYSDKLAVIVLMDLKSTETWLSDMSVLNEV